MFPSLADLVPSDRPRVGGKAAELGRLLKAELPVPDGFIVPTDVFMRVLADGGLGDEARRAENGDPDAGAALFAKVPTLVMPSDVEAALLAGARKLGGVLAVRSSGVDEDGRRRSFAGQHTTRLHVRPDDVVDAVRAVWASLYAVPALAYRGGRGPAPGSMAVIVQKLVDPQAAGVLFTVNPHNGSWREMVVEAVPGLADDLVSGRVTPHWWIVRRPRRWPGVLARLSARVRLSIVQEETPGSGPVLAREQLLKLCRLGLAVERLCGEPQDIEWVIDTNGRPFLVQARPITAAGPARPRDDVLWTRRFIGERWPDPATPLGWSLLAPIFEWFIAYPDTSVRHLGGGPALRLYHSRPYLNATVFRHLLFKLPGAPAPSFMLELVPPEEEAETSRRFGLLPGFAVYGSIFRETYKEKRWQRFRWNPFTNHKRWDEFLERFQRELPALQRSIASETDGLRLVDAQLALIRDYVSVHVTSLLFANLWLQVLDGLVSSHLPEDAQRLVEALATSPPGNKTLETNDALWDLAQQATESDLEALAANQPPSAPFRASLDAFLAVYGHRSAASWEVFSQRWGKHPALLVPLLRAHRGVGTERPLQRAHRQHDAYLAARAELEGKLPSGLGRRKLLYVLDLTRIYLGLRENQRFWFDHLLDALQGTLLAIGASLAARGALDASDDIAFLTWEEVRGLCEGTLASDVPVREFVARRRAQRDEDAAVVPPVFLRGDDGASETATGARLQGLGVSPGRARGRVRMLRSPAEGHRLGPGEILVTHAVDPGWTPLFVHAGGIVLEIGSRLSHGAVVAREYGIPCVANVEGLSRRLVDGQEITVDGTRGIVWVHP